MADVTPGTTSKGTSAASSAAASSPPRAKTNGSPPFRRTTVWPARPRSTRRALISSCGVDNPPGTLATLMRSAPAGARARRPSSESRS